MLRRLPVSVRPTRLMRRRHLHAGQFYIDGEWRPPAAAKSDDAKFLDVTNPATGERLASLALGTSADVDAAVAAARRAFDDGWSSSAKADRLGCLERLAALYKERSPEMAAAISSEMGAPISLARRAQTAAGLSHIRSFIQVLADFDFEERAPPGSLPHEVLMHEPLGVCACITPWNWPMNQVTLKVAAALAAGNTVVLKPSEVAPLSSLLFAELIHSAGFPRGAFNLVSGDGPTVGAALARHAGVDMVSFTGSTRAGVAVSQAAAEGVKRVNLELGGKGPNLIFADVGEALGKAVKRGVMQVMANSGQSCNAPTRMIVEASVYDEAVAIAAEQCASVGVGWPAEEGAHLGPVASEAQFEKVQALIAAGIEDGARLVCGGGGRPDGFTHGWFCRPTVFADVAPSMRIAREEIFGPVLSIMRFEGESEAIDLANDSPYGLTSYVQSGSAERIRRVVPRLRAGMVEVNGARRSPTAPFGGVKASGNGREGGVLGLREFLEVKAVAGWPGAM
jgi:aldehyde dehydrogenase (NAD+)